MSEIRVIEAAKITDAVAELCISANISIGVDIKQALSNAHDFETAPLAKSVLKTLLENADIAERERLPICQDTGMVVVFAWLGTRVHVSGNITAAINEGVRRGYRDGYFRNSLVADPQSRINTGDNSPAVIHYDFVEGDSVKLAVMPKGFGSENMSAVRMLKLSDGISGAENFVVETVQSAGANPCPPVIVGVGIGGTLEKAALLSKQALLREIGEVHSDPFWAEFEARLLARINALGIGPSGFGGHTTALAVRVLAYPTHIAGLPVAVNIGCHATRHKTVIL